MRYKNFELVFLSHWFLRCTGEGGGASRFLTSSFFIENIVGSNLGNGNVLLIPANYFLRRGVAIAMSMTRQQTLFTDQVLILPEGNGLTMNGTPPASKNKGY